MSWLRKILAPPKALEDSVHSPSDRLDRRYEPELGEDVARRPILGVYGHTLMEIVVVMAIVAILAGSAYPSYHRTVLKGHRIDATTSLLRIQLAQARYRTEHSAYAGSLDDLGWSTPALSDRGYYRIALDTGVNPAYGFRAIATPVPGSDQARDSCGRFVVDAGGPDRITSSASECWD
ncbi:MAG: prepilin-type N-terminal cleavage/methylation domain-containing protein [Gammaproteobacteria bacterium]|nr:prepilin-type N-terminal cleavage/methylation domain-containing protein [Gammaproteobacteria bacterium]